MASLVIVHATGLALFGVGWRIGGSKITSRANKTQHHKSNRAGGSEA